MWIQFPRNYPHLFLLRRSSLEMSMSNFLVPFPPLVSASPLDSLGPLVSSSSLAMPPPLAPWSSSASTQASPPPARYCSSPRLHFAPPGPCLHLSLAARRLRSGIAFPHMHSHEKHLHWGPSALGLLWAPSYIRTNLGRSSLSFCHRLLGLRLRLDPPLLRLHRAPPFLWFPHLLHLLHRCTSQPNPRLCLGHPP